MTARTPIRTWAMIAIAATAALAVTPQASAENTSNCTSLNELCVNLSANWNGHRTCPSEAEWNSEPSSTPGHWICGPYTDEEPAFDFAHFWTGSSQAVPANLLASTSVTLGGIFDESKNCTGTCLVSGTAETGSNSFTGVSTIAQGCGSSGIHAICAPGTGYMTVSGPPETMLDP